MESNRVAHTVHAVVKQAYHGKVNVAVGYRQVRLVSLAEGNELWRAETWSNGGLGGVI